MSAQDPSFEQNSDTAGADPTLAWLSAPTFGSPTFGSPTFGSPTFGSPTSFGDDQSEWADIDDHDRLLQDGHLTDLGVSVVSDLQAGVQDAAFGIDPEAVRTSFLHVASCHECPARVATVATWARSIAEFPPAPALSSPEQHPGANPEQSEREAPGVTTAPLATVTSLQSRRKQFFTIRYAASAAAVLAACTFGASALLGDSARLRSSDLADGAPRTEAAAETYAAAETIAPTDTAPAETEAAETIVAAAADTDALLSEPGGTSSPDGPDSAEGGRLSQATQEAAAPSETAASETAASKSAATSDGAVSFDAAPAQDNALLTTTTPRPKRSAIAAPNQSTNATLSGSPAPVVVTTLPPGVGAPAEPAAGVPQTTNNAALAVGGSPGGTAASSATTSPAALPTTLPASTRTDLPPAPSLLGNFESVTAVAARLREDPTLALPDVAAPCAAELTAALLAGGVEQAPPRFARATVAGRTLTFAIATPLGKPAVVVAVDESCRPAT